MASPSSRARETAEIIAAALGSPVAVETDPRWAEVDVGDAEGLTFEEVEARFPSLARQLAAADAEIDWPGGETAAALDARVAAAWDAVVTAGRPTIVVSHAGSIRVAAALATGRPAAEIAFPAPGEALHFEIEAIHWYRGRPHAAVRRVSEPRTPPRQAVRRHPPSSPRRRSPASPRSARTRRPASPPPGSG